MQHVSVEVYRLADAVLGTTAVRRCSLEGSQRSKRDSHTATVQCDKTCREGPARPEGPKGVSDCHGHEERPREVFQREDACTKSARSKRGMRESGHMAGWRRRTWERVVGKIQVFLTTSLELKALLTDCKGILKISGQTLSPPCYAKFGLLTPHCP